MAEKLNPTTAEEKDISKAQSAQQPTTEAEQQPKERAEEESGFIGTESERDTSAELVELDEDDEFKPDGQ